MTIRYSYHAIGFPPFLEHCLVNLFLRALPQLYLLLEILTSLYLPFWFSLNPISFTTFHSNLRPMLGCNTNLTSQLCCTSMHWTSLLIITFEFDSSHKTCGIHSKNLFLPSINAMFLNSSSAFCLQFHNLTSLVHCYTTFCIFISSIKGLPQNPYSNPYKASRSSLTLNLHSFATTNNKHIPQKCKHNKKRYRRETQPITSLSFTKTFRIKKGNYL